jgi:hypothetical protein
MVAIRLVGPDPECEQLCAVLNRIHCDEARGLGSGGGCGDDGIATIVVQRNDASGKLADCREEDRAFVARVLADSPEVANFAVGIIVPDGASDDAFDRCEAEVKAALESSQPKT